MATFRVLLLSDVRPSRAWKFASRILREIPGAEICGIVQRPLRNLPLAQQEIAAGRTSAEAASSPALQRMKRWIRDASGELLHRALWWIHGCPPNLPRPRKFTLEMLAGGCKARGWPFLAADSLSGKIVLEFSRRNSADLVIVLGQMATVAELRAVPRFGVIQVRERAMGKDRKQAPSAVQIAVEHFGTMIKSESVITSLTLPLQPADGILGLRLKADLLADDLLVQTAASSLRRQGAPVTTDVTEWSWKFLQPYLEQLRPASVEREPETRAFCRPLRQLCAETLLLCSPFILIRNWLRRWSARYPVLVLAHHLVSDRRHRLGISTERFWRQVRFLQRHYHVVSLAEAVALLQSGKVTTPAVSLSFDDGYADNFVSLRAVADEEGIPVSMFITTLPVNLRTEFQHDVANGESGALPLTWEQIRYWSRHGAEFGSHTRTHADCGTSDRATLQEEILGAKDELEHRLQIPVPFLAFPYGKPENISEEAIAVARSAHSYFLSFFGGENLPDDRGSNSHLVRKIAYAEPWELELELQSVFDFAGTVKRRIHGRDVEAAGTQRRPMAASSMADVDQTRSLHACASGAGCGAPERERTGASK
jgi:peptidoglycan/xylan/chitin deacetylase (PgdA/CDA1 family)